MAAERSLWMLFFALCAPGSDSNLQRRRLCRRVSKILSFGRVNRQRRQYSWRFWAELLLLPQFQGIIRSLRTPRRFWAAPRTQGLWEKDVCGLWRAMGKVYPDWEEKQYLQHFRVSKDTFWYLCGKYGRYFHKQTTQLRKPLPPAKRLAILLHWLAHGNSYSEVAVLYAVGKATVVAIVHDMVSILRQKLVPDSIKFPAGQELNQVIIDFQELCGVPMCAGALDGTFMAIKKPTHFGDTYFCYKKFKAIIVLGCVDARGIFTYVNAGRPGSVGDSYTYRHSEMYKKIREGEWLSCPPERIEGVLVKPFVVADAAFPLEPTCLKCYDSVHSAQQYSFNYSLIRTRRVVEQAYGRLKGRWKIMEGRCGLNDPVFARQVAVLCCALHNICERHQCTFEDGWLPDAGAYISPTPPSLQASTIVGSAASVRDAIAKHIHHTRPAPQ